MQFRTISAAAAAFAFLTVSGLAQAETAALASLSAVNGDVLVNQGQGFKPAAPGLALRAGDRVIVPANSHARLLYSGGCGVSLAPGSMATISNLAPCKIGLHQAGIVAAAADDPPPLPVEGAAAATPFGLPPGVLALLTVGVFTLGAAGLSGAFESTSP